MSSWKMEVCTSNGINWSTNSIRLRTHSEAEAYGRDLSMRWTAVTDMRVSKSNDPITHKWDPELGLVRLIDPDEAYLNASKGGP